MKDSNNTPSLRARGEVGQELNEVNMQLNGATLMMKVLARERPINQGELSGWQVTRQLGRVARKELLAELRQIDEYNSPSGRYHSFVSWREW